MVAFIGLATGLLFLFVSFRQGATRQIDSTIRRVYGDVRISARGNHSLRGVENFLYRNYGKDLQNMVGQLSLDDATLIAPAVYRKGTVTGVSENYFDWLGEGIYWIEGGPASSRESEPDGPVNAIVEKSYAEELNLGSGDTVTIKYDTEAAGEDSLEVRISGIFMGNSFHQGGKLFVPLQSLQDHIGEEQKIDLLLLNLKQPTEEKLHDVATDVRKNYKMEASLNVRKWETSIGYDTVFSQVWALMGLILILTGIAVITVASFGIYDSFYLDLRSRTEEISSLLTYGIDHRKLYLLHFLEVSLLLLCGGGGGFLMATIVALVTGNYPLVKNFSYLFMVLGGAYLKFSLFTPDVLVGFVITSLAAYLASFLALHFYLRKAVAEITDLAR